MRSNSRLPSLPPKFWAFWLLTVAACSLVALTQADFAFSQTPQSPPAAKPTTPATPPSPSQPPLSQGTDKPLLKVGSQGSEVTEVQALLKLLGYYKGPVNGIYEESTASAVSQFQKAAGLSSDGIVGTETWSNLLPPAPPATATNPTTAPTIPSTSPVTPESFPAPMPTKPAPPATTTPVTKPANPGSPQPVTVDNVTLPILRLGMKGPAVSGLQERLRALGYLKGGADGVFGPETQSAVKAAQRVLKLEADGVVGSATWLGLLR